MQRIITVVVVLAAVGIVSAFAASQLVPSHQAGAAPSLQAREDQIVVFSQPSPATGPAIVKTDPPYGLLYGTGPILVDVDAADYALSTTFRYDAVWTAASGSLSCLRLFDLTANVPVSGSEVCHTIPTNTGTEDVHVRSASFTLPTGGHEYTVQGKCEGLVVTDCSGGRVYSVRVIAEWTERR